MKLAIITFFVLLNSLIFCQSKWILIKHLEKNKLMLEWEYVLFQDTLNSPSDSLSLYRAEYYLYKKNNKGLFESLKLGSNLIETNSQLFIDINLYFLESNDTIKRYWCTNFLNFYKDSISLRFKNYFEILDQNKNVNLGLIDHELTRSYDEYLKFQLKKPFLSSFYSMIIPGLGKLYNGRKYSFRNVFLSHIFLATKFLESYHYLGLLNPYTLTTLGFYSIYYCANIIGSYYDLIEVKKEKKQQFIFDVKNYYLSRSYN